MKRGRCLIEALESALLSQAALQLQHSFVGALSMPFFQVQAFPQGIENSPIVPFVKVEALDELAAARQIVPMLLQRELRPDLHIRALVHRLGGGRRNTPTKIYAAS
jgi:hypothetical protein